MVFEVGLNWIGLRCCGVSDRIQIGREDHVPPELVFLLAKALLKRSRRGLAAPVEECMSLGLSPEGVTSGER